MQGIDSYTPEWGIEDDTRNVMTTFKYSRIELDVI